MKMRNLPALALACLLLTPIAAHSQGRYADSLEAARQGRVAEALREIEAAIAADPTDVEAHFTRGVILAESGRRNSAEQAFRRLIKTHPELPEAYNNLAVIQAAAGDFDGAVSTLKAALATNPTYQAAYENLTRIFAQLASEAYSRALEVDSPPERAEVELQLLAGLSRSGGWSAPPPPGALLADAKLTPAEPIAAPTKDEGDDVAAMPTAPPPPPILAVPSEPVSPPATGGIEGEDLAMEEMETAADPADLADLVESWARAWSDQRVDDYLAFYADEFQPDNGMSRADWVANRRDRITAPEFIDVEVAILDSVSEDDDRARVTFLQAYESNTYKDQVTKTLTLVRDGSEWKILEEKSGP